MSRASAHSVSAATSAGAPLASRAGTNGAAPPGSNDGSAGFALPLLEAPEVVLSTLNRDGSRRWLRPRVSHGRYLHARRALAYGLIALFTLLPHLRIAGKPVILLDIARRQFTLFGATFLPTDMVLLALLLLALFVSIFLITAVLGRVWCGWACPQTVYLEFVYRPLQRLLEGTSGRGGRPARRPAAWRTAVLYAMYLVISIILAHTFLAYFVGVEALARWVRLSPLEHTAPFLVMAVTTGLMMFNFCYFREQTCLFACPYGRFQSVMLDRNSLIVSYDAARGEPRGHLAPRSAGAAPRGDCIDCGLCVATCPTGIDIRSGLQMECVGCTQCIDACDAVMDKISRPRGLIRYTSQARLAGERGRVIRGRVVVYVLALTVAATGFGTLLLTRPAADIRLLRGLGLPYSEMPDGTIANPFRLKITNRTDRPTSYTVSVLGPDGITLRGDSAPLQLAPGAAGEHPGLIILPRSAFVGGHAECTMQIVDDAGTATKVHHTLLGPSTPPAGGH